MFVALKVKDCSFNVKRGEILGFYGLVGMRPFRVDAVDSGTGSYK